MEELKQKILNSGLKQSYIAAKVGIGAAHLNMMLSGRAKMKKGIKEKIEKLLEK